MINGEPDDVARYVTGGTRRYLDLLHGRFLSRPDDQRAEFVRALVHDSQTISDEHLALLLTGRLDLGGWQPRIVAAWLVGIGRRATFRRPIGELLLASDMTYAGQGYCVALAALGTEEDARILAEYLDRYLPQIERRYDQRWAMAALVHLDSVRGTHIADSYLTVDGPWQRWVNGLPNQPIEFEYLRSRIADACALQ
ncbi:hypothetical protein HDA40_005841 [Hamadaea flava]|uniref:DUF6000 family protein n=1 Tax=Hamadaea flava TaxID=1742688 RepID=A0ABV8LTL2_9ACTN|nr:DUF6000 family protein [Hamadaea flava]MCP2327334.1 hypothetical protein [Hamadaea flava]